jgi:hypothetical protein
MQSQRSKSGKNPTPTSSNRIKGNTNSGRYKKLTTPKPTSLTFSYSASHFVPETLNGCFSIALVASRKRKEMSCEITVIIGSDRPNGREKKRRAERETLKGYTRHLESTPQSTPAINSSDQLDG